MTPEGDSAIVVIEGLQILGSEHEYSAIGNIADLNGNELFEIGLKIEPINIIASIIDDGISGLSVFSPTSTEKLVVFSILLNVEPRTCSQIAY